MANLRRITHPRELGVNEIGRDGQGNVWLKLSSSKWVKIDGMSATAPVAMGGGSGVIRPPSGGADLSGKSGVIRVVNGSVLGDATTDDVPEGTSLYFSGLRVYTKAKAMLQGSASVTVTADDGAQTLTLTSAGGHAAVTLDANADALLSLTGQEIGLDTQTANKVLAGPTTGGAAVPTMRALVAADIPALNYVAADVLFTPNLLINGDGGIDQRAWGYGRNDEYSEDRWNNLCQSQPSSAGTCTLTGTGTSRTATVSSGTPFTADHVGAMLKLPSGFYVISAYTSSTVVTITTASGYVNESAVGYGVWSLGCAKALMGGTVPSVLGIKVTQLQATAQRFATSQIVEAANSFPARGNTLTFQGQIYWSSSSGKARVALLEWTGTADAVTSNVVNSWTNGTYTAGQFFNSTTLTVAGTAQVNVSNGALTSFSLSASVSTACTNLIVMVFTEDTQAQGNYFILTQADLFLGATSRTWQPRPVQQELALCQRNTRRLGGLVVHEMVGTGFAISTTSIQVMCPLFTEMRTTPTVIFDPTPSNWNVYDGVALITATALSISAATSARMLVCAATVASGLTQYRPYSLRANNTLNASIMLDAEL